MGAITGTAIGGQSVFAVAPLQADGVSAGTLQAGNIPQWSSKDYERNNHAIRRRHAGNCGLVRSGNRNHLRFTRRYLASTPMATMLD